MVKPRTSTNKKKKSEPVSRLVLFEPRSGEQEFNFVISLTEDMVEAIIEAYEAGAEPDQYGAVIKLGGAVYDNDTTISGTVYLRDDDDEAPRRKKRKEEPKREKRKAHDDYDDDDDEPPVQARKRRSLR